MLLSPSCRNSVVRNKRRHKTNQHTGRVADSVWGRVVLLDSTRANGRVRRQEPTESRPYGARKRAIHPTKARSRGGDLRRRAPVLGQGANFPNYAGPRRAATRTGLHSFDTATCVFKPSIWAFLLAISTSADTLHLPGGTNHGAFLAATREIECRRQGSGHRTGRPGMVRGKQEEEMSGMDRTRSDSGNVHAGLGVAQTANACSDTVPSLIPSYLAYVPDPNIPWTLSAS